MPTPLLIGSCDPFSGKSAVLLGLARQLLRQGVTIAYGKPLATDLDTDLDGAAPRSPADPLLDADVRFIGSTLGLPDSQLLPSVDVLEAPAARGRLLSGDLQPGAGFAALQQQLAGMAADLVLLEAAGRLSEGLLFGLGLVQMAKTLQAPVVLVHAWNDSRSADALLEARQQLGDLLAGVVLKRPARSSR